MEMREKEGKEREREKKKEGNETRGWPKQDGYCLRHGTIGSGTTGSDIRDSHVVGMRGTRDK